MAKLKNWEKEFSQTTPPELYKENNDGDFVPCKKEIEYTVETLIKQAEKRGRDRGFMDCLEKQNEANYGQKKPN